MDNQPTVLHINRIPNGYNFCLTRPDKPFTATMAFWDVKVTGTLTTMCNMLSNAVDDATTSPSDPNVCITPFVNIGRGLYNELLPTEDPDIEELRKALRELSTPLLISTDDPDIPWELLYDDEDGEFIGLKYDVGRSLKRRSVPRGVPRRNEEWRCLIIADPNAGDPDQELPGTAEEAVRSRRNNRKRR